MKTKVFDYVHDSTPPTADELKLPALDTFTVQTFFVEYINVPTDMLIKMKIKNLISIKKITIDLPNEY